MALTGILLLIIANAAWLYVYLSLLLVPGQLWFTWVPGYAGFEPTAHITLALLIVFVSQFLLLILLYSLNVRGRYLSSRYKQVKATKNELAQKTKENEKQLKQQLADLEKAGSVEEKNALLKERVDGLEKLVSELRLQNDRLTVENAKLQPKGDTAAPSLLEKMKSAIGL